MPAYAHLDRVRIRLAEPVEVRKEWIGWLGR